jgi:hypothetical protein
VLALPRVDSKHLVMHGVHYEPLTLSGCGRLPGGMIFASRTERYDVRFQSNPPPPLRSGTASQKLDAKRTFADSSKPPSSGTVGGHRPVGSYRDAADLSSMLNVQDAWEYWDEEGTAPGAARSLLEVPEAVGMDMEDLKGRPAGQGGLGATGTDAKGPPEPGCAGCVVVRLPGYFRVPLRPAGAKEKGGKGGKGSKGSGGGARVDRDVEPDDGFGEVQPSKARTWVGADEVEVTMAAGIDRPERRVAKLQQREDQLRGGVDPSVPLGAARIVVVRAQRTADTEEDDRDGEDGDEDEHGEERNVPPKSPMRPPTSQTLFLLAGGSVGRVAGAAAGVARAGPVEAAALPRNVATRRGVRAARPAGVEPIIHGYNA